jgi:hypothetical protein
MTNRATKLKSCSQHRLAPQERSSMLTVLELDPRFTYTDHELQSAWRRRKAQVRSETNPSATVTLINAAYVNLIRQAPVPRPLEVRL